MSADASLWAGLDLGTQSVKATIVTESGTIRATGQHPLSSTRDGDRHEQNPREWVDAAAAALAAALAHLNARERIGGISFCSTSGTVTVLDAHGSPATPGLMYDDARGAAFAPQLRDAGHERWRRLGVAIQPSWAACRIAWLADNALLPHGNRIAHQGDVVAEAMIGERVPTDWSSALKSGYDVSAREWPIEIFDGVDLGQLPEVVAPGALIGETSDEWQRASGLPQGTPVFAGTTDGCAAQLGAGALAPGDWHSVVGTTLVLKGVSDRPVSDGSGAVYSHRAPHGDLWLPGGASSVGAGAVSSLFPDADLAALDATIGKLTGRIIPSYPLTRRGERFPFVAADAHGFALTPGEQPLEALRELALPEAVESLWVGVACVERLCFDVLAGQDAHLTGRLSSSGGGTRSTTWNRLRASLLDHPIALPETAEGSLGTAILARWGAGVAGLAEQHPLEQIASAMSRIQTTIDPDAALAPRLADAYTAFRNALTQKEWIQP